MILYGAVGVFLLIVVYLLYWSRTRYHPPKREGMYPSDRAQPALVSGYIDKDATLPERWFGSDVEVARGLQNLGFALLVIGCTAGLLYGVGMIITSVIL